LQLGLAHLRAASDVPPLGLLVELVPRAATRARVRAQAAAATRRDVLARLPAALHGLAVARPLLVDRAGGDLLGDVLAAAALLESVADVLVLALALAAPRSPGHRCLLVLRWVSDRCALPRRRGGQPARDRACGEVGRGVGPPHGGGGSGALPRRAPPR